MKPFSEFCQRHDLDESTSNARDQYRKYQRQLELFRSAAGLGNDDEPARHIFSCGIGEITISRQGDDGFTVTNQKLGLFAQCQREHFTVECWPALTELGEPAGAQVTLSAPDAPRVVLSNLAHTDAARLAWFVGVPLVVDKE